MHRDCLSRLARSAAVAALLLHPLAATALADEPALAPPVQAEAPTLAPGTAAPRLTLNDQHDEPAAIDGATRLIVFAGDMGASGLAKEALAEDGQELLAAASAVYVANISGMPTMIARMFALPAMRRRPYRMLLDHDGVATAGWPTREGHLTLIVLAGDRVDRVEYVASTETLRAALADAAAPTHAATGAARQGV